MNGKAGRQAQGRRRKCIHEGGQLEKGHAHAQPMCPDRKHKEPQVVPEVVAVGQRLKVLNLGSGTKVSVHPDVTNVDWSMYMRLQRNPVVRRIAPLVLSEQRRRRLRSVPPNVLFHDLRRGIPFPDCSVDVVYHSHMFEHLDRSIAPSFQREILRVLKPGGIQRVVVPDLEQVSREYLAHLSICEDDRSEIPRHDAYVGAIIEQVVRQEPFALRGRWGLARALERFLMGDARRRGETHQWMYDWANLTAILVDAGFEDPSRVEFNVSAVEGWSRYGLDSDEEGNEYRPGSLYIEAARGS